MQDSIIAYFGLAFGLGALSLLTPCVFPLIPITVSYFLKRQESERQNSVLDAFVYSLSILLSFSLLGLMIALLFGASGLNKLASHPLLNLFIGILFLFFAFNLMGFYEIRIPSFLLLALGKERSSGGVVPTILMGITFTLTTFTCTMPFLGTVLISAATGDWGYPFLGMLGYGLSFAFPFFFLALFPTLLSKLPRSGSWMVSFKVVMGFLEILASLKFFSNADLVWNLGLLSKEVFVFISVMILLALIGYLFGLYKFPHESKKTTTQIGIFSGVTFLLFTIYLAIAPFFELPLGELNAYLPPSGYGKWTLHKEAKLRWHSNLETAKQEAQKSGKPIFLDFTGFTCVNCRWMEENIFTQEEVRSSLSRYVLVQLYTDGDGKEYEQNQIYQEKTFGTIGIPLYVILSPQGEFLAKSEGMTRNVKDFLKFLELGFQ
ncbi:MAG: thioredoxin family protein [Leptospiraceae bacterium]|nr:thioredoxin family protein [Leptospiraceae bacterium]